MGTATAVPASRQRPLWPVAGSALAPPGEGAVGLEAAEEVIKVAAVGRDSTAGSVVDQV